MKEGTVKEGNPGKPWNMLHFMAFMGVVIGYCVFAAWVIASKPVFG